MVPRAEGRLQPLAAVWRRAVLPLARRRIEAGELSLHGLAEEVGAEIIRGVRVAGARPLRKRLREPQHARALRGAPGESMSDEKPSPRQAPSASGRGAPAGQRPARRRPGPRADGRRRRASASRAGWPSRGASSPSIAAAFEALASGRLAKGDALAVARLAGIQAAKRTSEIVPLCHPLALESVEVDVALDAARREAVVTATARITGKTGVEMEALTAASAACLALYDMIKALDRVGVDPGDRARREDRRPVRDVPARLRRPMRYRYFLCDVFTDRLFGGNPLAVLPDARGLTDRQMQQIAREFNFSESSFVLPPEQARRGGSGSSRRRPRCRSPAIPTSGRPSPWRARASSARSTARSR